MIIYKATNKANGKVYIGQTVRTLSERMTEHQRHHATAFDKALQKYGADGFVVEQIDTAETMEELNQKEEFWIQHYGCIVPDGYNMCNGGGNTKGFHHSEESRRKMGEAKADVFVGDGNPFFGKTHTEESKRKMSSARKGMAHLTDEQVAKIRASHHKTKVRNVETDEVFLSVKAAAEHYGLKDTHITRVCKGHRKTTGGFQWEYVNEP